MGATYFKNALSTSREHLTIDWDALEEAWETTSERRSHEQAKRDIEWVNSVDARCFSGSRGNSPGTETVLRPGQDDFDIASLQHRRVSDQQE